MQRHDADPEVLWLQEEGDFSSTLVLSITWAHWHANVALPSWVYCDWWQQCLPNTRWVWSACSLSFLLTSGFSYVSDHELFNLRHASCFCSFLMLIFAGLAVFLTGGELVRLLPKLWEKMKVSGKVLVREYGFSRVGQGDCIYSSKLSSTQEHRGIWEYGWLSC